VIAPKALPMRRIVIDCPVHHVLGRLCACFAMTDRRRLDATRDYELAR